MTTEEWRPILRAEGYDASSEGRVRSWYRPRRRSWDEQPHLLAVRMQLGYVRVCIQMDHRNHNVGVHQLVAEAFIGPRPEGLIIRHLDGDSTNNRAANLRYGTASENEYDKQRHGTDHNVNKTHCPQGHPYVEENLVQRRKRVARECRACANIRAARRRDAARAARGIRIDHEPGGEDCRAYLDERRWKLEG